MDYNDTIAQNLNKLFLRNNYFNKLYIRLISINT